MGGTVNNYFYIIFVVFVCLLLNERIRFFIHLALFVFLNKKDPFKYVYDSKMFSSDSPTKEISPIIEQQQSQQQQQIILKKPDTIEFNEPVELQSIEQELIEKDFQIVNKYFLRKKNVLYLKKKMFFI